LTLNLYNSQSVLQLAGTVDSRCCTKAFRGIQQNCWLWWFVLYIRLWCNCLYITIM